MNTVQVNPKRYVKPMKSACAPLTLGKKLPLVLVAFFGNDLRNRTFVQAAA
ncbi:hypothetical protein [uncultured Roseobacter sp.]|uniref:hypothetical protein n=1 Tax=uncultured Roseobacter sp. TaxID=114847 RepID=UPI00261EB7E4|nr:hypothetical protein [uncultured Roseobacter sp.]